MYYSNKKLATDTSQWAILVCPIFGNIHNFKDQRPQIHCKLSSLFHSVHSFLENVCMWVSEAGISGPCALGLAIITIYYVISYMHTFCYAK